MKVIVVRIIEMLWVSFKCVFEFLITKLNENFRKIQVALLKNSSPLTLKM